MYFYIIMILPPFSLCLGLIDLALQWNCPLGQIHCLELLLGSWGNETWKKKSSLVISILGPSHEILGDPRH